MLPPPDPATAAALARLYDLDLADDPGDLDLYLALAARGDGPVLELAAGTGRLAIPLAAAGHDVTAVDIDPAMIARGRDRAAAVRGGVGQIDWVEADLRDMRLSGPARFSLAFIALNSMMLLGSRDAQRAAVRTLAAHVAPGGIAAADVWLPDADDLARFDGRIMLEWARTDVTTGMTVTKVGSAVHDAATNTIVLTAIYEETEQGGSPRRWIRRDQLRLVSADELAGFAEDAGLRVDILAGDYELGALGPGSERAILVAERP